MAVALNSIFLGMLKDNDYTAAWGVTSSIGGVNYCLAGGMGQLARTAVSNFVGKSKNNKAKEYAFKAIFTNLIFVLIFCALCIVGRFELARIFSGESIEQHYLEKILLVYGMVALTDGMLCLNSSLLRI